MRFYELTYLISPELSEEELKSFQEKINALIEKEGGSLGEFNSPIKKVVAYSINKAGEAFLATINFYLPEEKLTSLEKKLKQESEILRYLILTKPPTKIMVEGEKKVIPPIKPRLVKPKPKPKVELKEIEKKLEEILGET